MEEARRNPRMLVQRGRVMERRLQPMDDAATAAPGRA
jgi:hypothetical protein